MSRRDCTVDAEGKLDAEQPLRSPQTRKKVLALKLDEGHSFSTTHIPPLEYPVIVLVDPIFVNMDGES